MLDCKGIRDTGLEKSDHYPTISRRNFFGQSAIALAGAGTLNLTQAARRPNAQTKFTVIAYNVYGCNGWPKDNAMAMKAREAGQMPTRFAHELALYDPDIITFSESPEEAVVREIAKKLGMIYTFFPSAGNWPGALLTRHHIVDTRNLPLNGKRPDNMFTRHWGKATVRLPDGTAVIVHSCHFFPHDKPEAGIIREQEISQILIAVKQDIRNGRSVILMGDLNHTPEMPEYKMWMDDGWVDTFAKVGEGSGLTIRPDIPERRIDYVLAKGPICANILVSRPLFEGKFRTNPADPKSFALSDHLPQLAVFAVP